MQRSDLLVFLGTFLFGVFTGVYLYYMGWQPNFDFANKVDLPEVSTIQVIAEQYGDCELSEIGCASYRVVDDRSYRLIYIDGNGNLLNEREDVVSRRVWNNFVDILNNKYKSDTLSQYPSTRPSCQSRGTGIRYRIQMAEHGSIVLDLCDRKVVKSDKLYQSLNDITDLIGVR